MKILIPTAKEMNLTLSGKTMSSLSAPIQAIVDTLVTYQPEALAKFYKIKPELAEIERTRLVELKNETAEVYSAWQLFNGLMYRQMKRENLSENEQFYLKQHVFITSALYGLINVFDDIAPHRLDFLMGLQVDGQSLKHYWRDAFAQAVSEDDLIISLLSSEFEAVFPKSVQARMAKLNFMESRDGRLKVHSTISKKARGKCLNALVANQVQNEIQLRQLNFDGFKYDESLSEEKVLTFIKLVD